MSDLCGWSGSHCGCWIPFFVQQQWLGGCSVASYHTARRSWYNYQSDNIRNVLLSITSTATHSSQCWDRPEIFSASSDKMLNIHGQELEDPGHWSSHVHNKDSFHETVFLVYNISQYLENHDRILLSLPQLCSPRALALLIGGGTDPLENLPAAFWAVIQYQADIPSLTPQVPAGSIYINSQFMQPFSSHNNLPCWCCGASLRSSTSWI